MSYDSNNRLVSRTDPSGLTLTYGYDANGNVTSVSDSQGGLTRLAYNELGQVTSKTFQDGSSQVRVDFTYDAAGNEQSQTRYSDFAGTQKVGVTEYGYQGGQLISQVEKDGSGYVL